MKYRCEIEVPITLSEQAVGIRFSQRILVGLHCSECQRSHRTVVLCKDPVESYCTPLNHTFPGHIVDLTVSDRQMRGFFAKQPVVTATYLIEYEFEKFVDDKYPRRWIRPKPRWARADFEIECTCGERKRVETDPQIVRPYTAECKCGRDLHYGRRNIPLFKKPYRESTPTFSVPPR